MIFVERKQDIAKRIKRSPDKGDAVIYASACKPIIVGYETVRGRSMTGQQIAKPLSWKNSRGTI